MIGTYIAQQIDRIALTYMNHNLPASFEPSYHHAPTLESVLANTQVYQAPVTPTDLSRPGQYHVLIETTTGILPTRFKLQPAIRPDAPLILFHHGFNELPYDSSWQRVFRPGQNYRDCHLACVQTLFHNHWADPLKQGFATLESVYQMFATSLRLMAYLQDHFEAQGSPYTAAVGYSWGGVTSLLYQGLYGRAKAVAPLFAGPDLGQVLLDIATMFNRIIQVPPDTISELLDFTPYYHACDPTCVFPLLGEHDVYFRLPHHQASFNQSAKTISSSHITGMWNPPAIRQHLDSVLAWCNNTA